MVALLHGDRGAAERARTAIARGREIDPTLLDLELAAAELAYAEARDRGGDPERAAATVMETAGRRVDLRPLRALRSPGGLRNAPG